MRDSGRKWVQNGGRQKNKSGNGGRNGSRRENKTEPAGRERQQENKSGTGGRNGDRRENKTEPAGPERQQEKIKTETACQERLYGERERKKSGTKNGSAHTMIYSF